MTLPSPSLPPSLSGAHQVAVSIHSDCNLPSYNVFPGARARASPPSPRPPPPSALRYFALRRLGLLSEVTEAERPLSCVVLRKCAKFGKLARSWRYRLQFCPRRGTTAVGRGRCEGCLTLELLPYTFCPLVRKGRLSFFRSFMASAVGLQLKFADNEFPLFFEFQVSAPCD